MALKANTPPTLATYPRLELTNLFNIAQYQNEIPWKPFADGVEIHRLYGDGINGPAAALFRFSAGGKVPAHRHGGYEHILVLAGSQTDQNGEAMPGTLVVNPPGSIHSVMSAGCIVLCIYERPVEFLPES